MTGFGVWALTRPEVAPADLIRFTIVPQDIGVQSDRRDLAISPDGTQIVYANRFASGDIHVHRLDGLTSTPLQNARGFGPFFSPDGEWVGFQSSGRALHKISVSGGLPVTLAELDASVYGGDWGADGQIILGTYLDGLFRVSEDRGEPEALTTLEAGETSHVWPSIIPGANAVLFVIGSEIPLLFNAQLAVLNLVTLEVTKLGLAGTNPQYVSTGHVVYVASDKSLNAVPFDTTRLELSGSPVPLLENINTIESSSSAYFSVSDNGRLVYALGGSGPSTDRSLVWVDRAGREEPLGVERANYQEFDLSPDGRRLAVRIGNADPAVWIYDLTDGTRARLTFESDNVGAQFPTWTPDGMRVAFGGPLSWRRADGTGQVERLDNNELRYPRAFSPDGTMLIFEDRSGGRFQLGILGLEGSRTPTVLLDEETRERNPTVSPDGKWLAYNSQGPGTDREVYVRPFPDVEAGRWQISTGGGDWPLWSPAGDELFYRGPTGLMALQFTTDPTFTPATITQLFERRLIGGVSGRRIAVSSDGQRFLLFANDVQESDTPPAQLGVVLNWHKELLERVPVD